MHRVIDKFKPLLDFFSVIGGFSGALISVGIIYIWIKKPVNVFNKLNKGAEVSQENKVRLDKLEPTIDKLMEKMEQHDIDTMRSSIINFATDVKNGEKKTEIQYKYILDLCQRYSDENNGYVVAYIHYIQEKHRETQGMA